jgi:hypothetical protein
MQRTLFFLALAAAALAILPGCDAGSQRDEPRAEIQINLCAPPQDVIEVLTLRPDAAGPTEVWYFDTPDLEFSKRGLVFRLRLGDRKPELTLKVASQDCARIRADRIPAGEGKCEYDNHGAVFSGTVSLEAALDDAVARELIEGRLPLDKVLTPTQTAYLRNEAANGPLMTGVRPIGPAKIRQYRKEKAGFDVNVWTLPAGETTVELSQKESFKNVLQRRSELLEMLSHVGIALCPDQGGQGIDRLGILLGRT